jgi:3D (Asp-Asp-Asp) domain-containing protein
MKNYLKSPISSKKILFFLIGTGLLMSVFFLFEPKTLRAEPEFMVEDKLSLTQDSALLPISDPTAPGVKIARKLPVVVTAYSSSVWETDSDPFITAAGTEVRDGIVANNLLPFGTKVRIPEIYGDKIFVVEDRMSQKKGNYQIDIWFPSYSEAKSFGAQKTYIEVLEN